MAGEEVGVENVQNTFKNSTSFFFFFLEEKQENRKKKTKGDGMTVVMHSKDVLGLKCPKGSRMKEKQRVHMG